MSEKSSVGVMFDTMGKSHNAEFFALLQNMLFSYQGQYSNQGLDLFEYLLGGLSFVFDASIVQKALRWELREKVPSDLINAAKAGFISPIAPKFLDEEIAKHAPEIAEYCGVNRVDVLRHYEEKIRPHLRFADIQNTQIFEDVRASIRDIKDTSYVAIHFERKTIGIVTDDPDIKEYPERIESFSVKDICDINILFRKQYVVLYISVIDLVIFFGLITFVFKALWGLRKYIAGGLLIGAGILLLVRLFNKERYETIMNRIFEMTGDMKAGALEVWDAVQPFLMEYLDECSKRTSEFREKIGPLAKSGKSPMDSLSSGKDITYPGFIKMIMLVFERVPLREKDICTVFEECGYPIRGKGSLRINIRRTLKTNPLFSRLKNGTYFLNDEPLPILVKV